MIESLINITILAENASALIVAVPLLCSLLCAMTRSSKLSWWITFLAISFTAVCSLIVSHQIGLSSAGEVRYYLGGWEPPYGIEFRIDRLNLIFISLISFLGVILLPYASYTVKREIDEAKHGVFYCLFLLCFSGLAGILATNDIFNLYVFLEISSLATYALISLGKDRRALPAAFSYLILGTIGATFILIAIGLLYIVTGTLNLDDLAVKIADIKDTTPIYGAFAFLCIGVFLKTALFPLHIWLTNAYTYSPAFVSTFLSCTATKVSVYVFIRFIFYLFGYEYSFVATPLSEILIFLAVTAAIAGSISAIYNPNIRRIFAFSSVAQMGYIMLAIGLATPMGLAVALTHIINHAFAKSLLFASAGAIGLKDDSAKMRLEDMHGLGRKYPFAFAGIVIGGLSLIGVPLTAGFISKWYLLNAIMETYPYLIPVLIITSLMAIIYIWKVVEVLYFKPENKDQSKTYNKKVIPASNAAKLTILILMIANIFFGIFTALTWENALSVAEMIYKIN